MSNNESTESDNKIPFSGHKVKNKMCQIKCLTEDGQGVNICVVIGGLQ